MKTALQKCCIVLLLLHTSLTSCMEQPERKLTYELVQLTEILDALEKKLQKNITSPLESLPNEIIAQIIETKIPKKFQHASEIINAISMQSLSNTNKMMKEQFGDYIKTKLSEALKASKNIYKELDPDRFGLIQPRIPGRLPYKNKIRIVDKALLKAFKKNNFTVMKFLLENGADIEARYKTPIDPQDKNPFFEYFTLLMLALHQKDIRKVNFLLSFIKNRDESSLLNDSSNNKTPLYIAIQANFKEGIEALFKAAQKNNISELNVGILPQEKFIQARNTLEPFIKKYKVGIGKHLRYD